MILRPVRPASPYGPPIVKLPEGFIMYLVRSSKSSLGNRSLQNAVSNGSISLFVCVSECWWDISTVCIRTGDRLPSVLVFYSIVTCDLESGLNHAHSFSFFLFIDSSSNSLCANTVVNGKHSGVSSVA